MVEKVSKARAALLGSRNDSIERIEKASHGDEGQRGKEQDRTIACQREAERSGKNERERDAADGVRAQGAGDGER